MMRQLMLFFAMGLCRLALAATTDTAVPVMG